MLIAPGFLLGKRTEHCVPEILFDNLIELANYLHTLLHSHIKCQTFNVDGLMYIYF